MLEQLKEELHHLHLELPRHELVKWTGGNISARDPESGLVVIKPSGVMYDELGPEDHVVVNLDGEIMEGDLKPSSDTASHLYIYRHRPDINGIVHTHSPYATAFAALGKPIPVYGDGSMSRDFTYIDDIINGVAASIERCSGYHIYNLGESRPINVNDLIAEIENALGKKATKNYLPVQPGDVDRTYADVAKAQRDLDYQPATHIATGLAEFMHWLRQLPS